MKKKFYDLKKVNDLLSGRWLEVLAYLADDDIADAINKPGKHVACPCHKTTNRSGKGDGFRLFKDAAQTGGGICNTCGSFKDGYALLYWLKGWDFSTSLEYIADYLGVEPASPAEREKPKLAAPAESKKPKLAAPVAPAEGEKPKPVEPEGPKLAPPIKPERMAEIKRIQEEASKGGYGSKQARQNIESVWSQSLSIEENVPSPLFRYWKKRGVLLKTNTLNQDECFRFHPKLPYFDEDGKKTGSHPALISAMKDNDGNIVTLHRTYLTAYGGKARVPCARKMMAVPDQVNGCAIRIGGMPSDGVIGVGEGSETAMSALWVYGIPTWSCVSATIMEGFIPPKEVHTILGWEDKDLSHTGQRSMKILSDRMDALGVNFIRMPIHYGIKKGKKSIDWNDILLEHGRYGFPSWRNLRRAIETRDSHVLAV